MNNKCLCHTACNFFKNVFDKAKRNFLPVLILILILLAVITVYFGFQKEFENKDLFTCAAVLVSAAALLYNAHKIKQEDNEKSSKFYLENYIKVSSMILEKLFEKTPSRRRMNWHTASIIADKLIKLEGKITGQADKEVLKIYQRNMAHDIGLFFREQPAMYYTGIDANNHEQSLDDALKQPEIKATSDPIPKIPPSFFISKKSIKTILDIINPIFLEEVNYQYTNDEEFHNVVKFNYPNLAEYLEKLKEKGLDY